MFLLCLKYITKLHVRLIYISSSNTVVTKTQKVLSIKWNIHEIHFTAVGGQLLLDNGMLMGYDEQTDGPAGVYDN